MRALGSLPGSSTRTKERASKGANQQASVSIATESGLRKLIQAQECELDAKRKRDQEYRLKNEMQQLRLLRELRCARAAGLGGESDAKTDVVAHLANGWLRRAQNEAQSVQDENGSDNWCLRPESTAQLENDAIQEAANAAETSSIESQDSNVTSKNEESENEERNSAGERASRSKDGEKENTMIHELASRSAEEGQRCGGLEGRALVHWRSVYLRFAPVTPSLVPT